MNPKENFHWKFLNFFSYVAVCISNNEIKSNSANKIIAKTFIFYVFTSLNCLWSFFPWCLTLHDSKRGRKHSAFISHPSNSQWRRALNKKNTNLTLVIIQQSAGAPHLQLLPTTELLHILLTGTCVQRTASIWTSFKNLTQISLKLKKLCLPLPLVLSYKTCSFIIIKMIKLLTFSVSAYPKEMQSTHIMMFKLSCHKHDERMLLFTRKLL